MKTIYRSEVLNKDFEDVAALEAAEAKYNEEHAKELALKEERTKDAKNVELLYKKANDAYKEANEALNEFLKKYPGGYHTTIKSVNGSSVSDIVDTLFDRFFI